MGKRTPNWMKLLNLSSRNSLDISCSRCESEQCQHSEIRERGLLRHVLIIRRRDETPEGIFLASAFETLPHPAKKSESEPVVAAARSGHTGKKMRVPVFGIDCDPSLPFRKDPHTYLDKVTVWPWPTHARPHHMVNVLHCENCQKHYVPEDVSQFKRARPFAGPRLKRLCMRDTSSSRLALSFPVAESRTAGGRARELCKRNQV